MFVVSRKGVVRTGRTPTLLSGYGGFNVGRTPVFNRNTMLLLMEHGGIYADVQLRGGNELAKSGIARACWKTSSMCSMISSPRLNT